MFRNKCIEPSSCVRLCNSGLAQVGPTMDEDEEGAELDEEEELETVRVSETEFNFLDFIKRCVQKRSELKFSVTSFARCFVLFLYI